MLKFRRSDWIALAVILGPVFLGGGSWLGYQAWYRLPRNWTSETIAETQRRGDIIRERITTYRAQHGRLPPELSALGTDLPEPTAGMRRWIYKPSVPAKPPMMDGHPASTLPDADFELRINGAPMGYPATWYTHSRGTWRVDM